MVSCLLKKKNNFQAYILKTERKLKYTWFKIQKLLKSYKNKKMKIFFYLQALLIVSIRDIVYNLNNH